jgi:hypothetical protein
MTIRQYLMKVRQDDARRAGERDRLLLEAATGPQGTPRVSRSRRPRPAYGGQPPGGPQHRRFPAPIAVGVALVLAVITALIVIAVWHGLAPGPVGHRSGARPCRPPDGNAGRRATPRAGTSGS